MMSSTAHEWTQEELRSYLTNNIRVAESDAGTVAASLLNGGYKNEAYLLAAESQHLKELRIPTPVISTIFKYQGEVEQAKSQFRSPPAHSRRAELPSEGKVSAKRPRVSSMAPPSSDDNDPDSSRSALKYVATETLHCSSSMIAMQVVQLLEKSINETNPDDTDDKCVTAAAYVLKIRKAISDNLLNEEDVKKNERFFTGAFCDALNAITSDDGVSFLHQGCIGHGATHSDFSARDILSKTGSSPTLLVGEGKANESSDIRSETRGQMFNELIRHRKIDTRLGFRMGARPVLLLAVNFGHIALDLAFPSKKGNAMEKKGWLTFRSLSEETETFWTIPVATVTYSKGDGEKKLPVVLRFIVDTLKYLRDLGEDLPRQQFKTPFVTAPQDKLNNGEKRGDNVTILETDTGRRVYKEFCYYLRQDDGFNTWDNTVRASDQRKPPSGELLQALGEPYASWKVETGPFGIEILSYDCVEGNNWPTSKDTWKQVLQQVALIHGLGYVHGDMLPRNVIFSEQAGHVIDFDLTRKEGEPYVSRYNYADFAAFRHYGAQAGKAMVKEHDVWSLVKMTETFFDIDFAGTVHTTVNDLIHAFMEAQTCELRNPDADIVNEATSSPQR